MDYVERHIRLGVLDLNRQGALKPGSSATMKWGLDGKSRAIIGYEAGTGKITLQYRFKVKGQKYQDVVQQIPLHFTPCNYGGRRPWFTCRCGRRVAVLYAAGKWFLCANSYRLIHRSVNEGKRRRAYRKMIKIRSQLGYDDNIWAPILFKPKRMHVKTFRRCKADREKEDK